MKARNWMSVLSEKRWFVFLTLTIIILLSTTTVYGGRKNTMEYLYDNFGKTEALKLIPKIYKIDTRSSISLFPVPFDNAVGTNDLRNAITVISFPEGKLDMENYFRSLFGDVRGGGTFLPVIPPDSIGFGQTRRFLMYNFKTGGHKKFRIVPSIDETIFNIAIADAKAKKFIFEIKEFDRSSEDHRDNTYFLYLMDLSGDEVKVLKKVNIGQGSIWAVSESKVFVWYFNKKIMDVYDMNLEQAQHPIGEVIKKHKDKIDFNQLAPHLTLPFAIVAGGEFGSMFINWSDSRSQKACLLLSGATQFSFSPDCKWVTFKQYISLREERTYLMPVSAKYPHYLGSPILLVKKYFDPPRFAWTNNPVSFVGSLLEELYRWELTKEAQKEMMGDDFDKYETFHDWIVAKDLEKLTKEKKQGLK